MRILDKSILLYMYSPCIDCNLKKHVRNRVYCDSIYVFDSINSGCPYNGLVIAVFKLVKVPGLYYILYIAHNFGSPNWICHQTKLSQIDHLYKGTNRNLLFEARQFLHESLHNAQPLYCILEKNNHVGTVHLYRCMHGSALFATQRKLVRKIRCTVHCIIRAQSYVLLYDIRICFY